MSDVGGATLQSTTEKSSRVDPNRASHGRWRHRDSSVNGLRTETSDTGAGVEAWHGSNDRTRAVFKKQFWLVVAALIAGAGVVTGIMSLHVRPAKTGHSASITTANPLQLLVGGMLLVIAIAAALSSWYQYGSVKAEFLQRHERRKVYAAIQRISDDPRLQQLINLNQAQMDAYHELTLAQATDAYRNTQAAMAIGFLVLLAGAVTVVAGSADATGRAVVGGLAGVGTALSGYIAGTFLRAQQESLRQLNFYFRQPLVNSYLLTAERLTRNMPDALQSESWAHMADQVVAQAFGTPIDGVGASQRRGRSKARRPAEALSPPSGGDSK